MKPLPQVHFSLFRYYIVSPNQTIYDLEISELCNFELLCAVKRQGNDRISSYPIVAMAILRSRRQVYRVVEKGYTELNIPL